VHHFRVCRCSGQASAAAITRLTGDFVERRRSCSTGLVLSEKGHTLSLGEFKNIPFRTLSPIQRDRIALRLNDPVKSMGLTNARRIVVDDIARRDH
jgi:hypothetical protein